MRLFAIAMLSCASIFAQAVRFDNTASTVSGQVPPGALAPILAIPGTQVNFCNGNAVGTVSTAGTVVTWVSGPTFTGITGSIQIAGKTYTVQVVVSSTVLVLTQTAGTQTAVPYSSLSGCLANPATTYTDATAGTSCSLTAQLTPQLGGVCVSVADNQGNYGGWFLPGSYYYYLRTPPTAGSVVSGPYPISIGASAGCPLGATCDANYATLALGCTAAGSGTLYVTRVWNATPTQSFGCEMSFLGNGKIQPASGQTVTFTVQQAGLTTICDISAGGSCIIHAPGGIQYPEWRGARADGATASGPAILATMGQIPCGMIRFSPGQYETSVYLVKDMTTGDDCDLEGVLGNGNSPGTVIQWTGAQYGTIMGLQGNSTDFQAKVYGIAFDGNSLASVGLWVDKTRSPVMDRLFFDNFIRDTMNSTASLNTGTGIWGGSITHTYFFAGSQRAIGLNLGSQNGAPKGWTIENNYFQQVQNWLVDGSNTTNVKFCSNIVDGLLANTGQLGVRLDATNDFLSCENYFESVYGTIFSINPTLNWLGGGSPVGQSARFFGDVIINSGHAATPAFLIANSRGVDIRGETLYQQPAGSPGFISIASTAAGTLLGPNDVYGINTTSAPSYISDSSTSTVYTDTTSCFPKSYLNVLMGATTTIITLPLSGSGTNPSNTVQVQAWQDTEHYFTSGFFDSGTASTFDDHQDANLTLSSDGMGHIQVTNGIAATRTVFFSYCYQ